jgi:hypothetical protein
MSKRHRDDKPLRNPKEVRRLQQRAARHRVDQTLHEAGDVDAVLLVDPRREKPTARTVVSGKVRHWKQKSWKRRSAVNAQRNAALAALLQVE